MTLEHSCSACSSIMKAQELKGSTDGSDEWQQLRAWSIGSLHLQKAETSTLSTELASDAVKSAILVSAQTETWLLILSGSEERDSFFSAMQILQLYQTLAEQCPVSTPKKGEAATPTEREGDRALLRQGSQLFEHVRAPSIECRCEGPSLTKATRTKSNQPAGVALCMQSTCTTPDSAKTRRSVAT